MSPQRLFKAIGSYGCLILSVIEAVGLHPYAYQIAEDALKQGIISPDTFILTDHNRFAGLLTVYLMKTGAGKRVTYYGWSKTPVKDMVNIGRYHYTDDHFVVMSDDGTRCVFDPYGESTTRSMGKLEDFRVYKME